MIDRSMKMLAVGCFGAAAVILASRAIGLDAPPAPPAPASEPAPPKDNPPDQPDAPPSLDELLGLPRDKTEAKQPDQDITEKLTKEEDPAAGADMSALFLEAVDSMGKSATMLLDQRSSGLATQRLQEQALLKLDTLIAQAQQQSNQKQSPQSQQSPQQAPEQQQQQQQQGNTPPGTTSGQVGDHSMPLRQTDLNGAIDETRSEWGNLPPRVRELLRQGRGDSAARLYQRLTEIYYQRLAEEAQP